MIGNEYSLVRLVPVCCSYEQLEEEGCEKDKALYMYILTSSMMMPLKSDVHVTEEPMGRELRMRVLHRVMKIIVGPLKESDLKGFVVKTRELVK